MQISVRHPRIHHLFPSYVLISSFLFTSVLLRSSLLLISLCPVLFPFDVHMLLHLTIFTCCSYIALYLFSML